MSRAPRRRVRLSELTEFLVEIKTRLHADEAAPSTLAGGHARRDTDPRALFRYRREPLGETVEIGQETVWYGDVPIWGMGWHGGVRREFVAMRRPIFAFLREALASPDPGCPARGPGRLQRDRWLYVNHLTGDMRSFVGREAIYWQDQLVCFYDYVGGEISAAVVVSD
jgi:hypothetical protein